MASFNYMVILGEFQRGEAPPTTSYYQFYQSMINVPYLGSSIPILLPSLIILFTVIFAGLSALKLKNRAIHAFRIASSEATKQDDDQSKTLVEAIMRGERAILQEIQLARTKAERNKLLRYNQPVAPPPAIIKKQPVEESKQAKNIFAKVTLIEEEQKELSRSLLEKQHMNSSI